LERFDNSERLKVLQGLSVLDTGADARLDAITILAKAYFDVPIALVSLIDEDRHWFKSRQGLSVREVNRDLSFGNQVIRQAEPLVVPDTRLEDRFEKVERVSGAPHIRFYAGAPIFIDGFPVGTVCIIDTKPRELSEADIAKLVSLADMAAPFLESHREGIPAEYLDDSPKVRDRQLALEEAVQARRESENTRLFLEQILKTIPDVVFVKDSEFKIVLANDALLKLYPPESRDSIIGSTSLRRFLPEIALRLRQATQSHAISWICPTARHSYLSPPVFGLRIRMERSSYSALRGT